MLDVLVVEPLEQMAEVYKNMIPWEMYGFSITSVCDTEQQAISYFGEYPYALVICDLRLKRGNGLSLIKRIRSWMCDCGNI